MTSRLLAALLAAGLWACSDSAPPSASRAAGPDAGLRTEIETAVRRHLDRRSDLDMSAMDLTIDRVDVDGDSATAVVSFQVRGTPEAGMSMEYPLAREAGVWTVQAKPSGHGEDAPRQVAPPAPGGGGAGLPPGHPPLPQ